MSDGAKKGALGLVAMLGLVGARSADNCAGAAARGARVAGDELARVGARSGDDLLGPGARGLDDALPPAGRVQWGPTPRAAETVASPVASNDELVEALAEGGVDVVLEVLRYDTDGLADAPQAPTKLACPVPKDLTLEPELWSKYLDGFGIACAPKIWIGRAKGDTFEVEGTYAPVADLLQSCANAGGVCVFVGCEGEGRCFSDARRATRGGDLNAGLMPYVYALAQRELERAKPAWVAFSPSPGEVTLVRPEPAS